MATQVKLFSNPAEVEKVEQDLGVSADALEDAELIPRKDRPYVAPSNNVEMENYALVSTRSDGQIEVKVVSVYVLPKCDTVEPTDLENEVDVWRQHLLADIDRESEQLGKALSLVFR